MIMRLFKKYRKKLSIALLLSMVVLPLVSLVFVPFTIEEPELEVTAGEQVKIEVNEEIEEPKEVFVDPNNCIFPYNTMSADWGVELYERGFRYYQIPQAYIDNGGCLPEVVQGYIWSQCEERGLDYYIVLAMIEKESSYRYDATGDSGASKGYMQVQERWHWKRMQAEGVTDLYDPYGNIRTGLRLLQDLHKVYPDADLHFILMCYNMGESKAIELYYSGTYSTGYSRGVIQRAQEIKDQVG